jgi:hypothetical protein
MKLCRKTVRRSNLNATSYRRVSGTATVFKLDGGKRGVRRIAAAVVPHRRRVHSGEITALAAMISAFSAAQKRPEKLPLLVNELVTLGSGDDWGSTQANSLSLLALRNYLSDPADNGKITGDLHLRQHGRKSDAATRTQRGALQNAGPTRPKADFRISAERERTLLSSVFPSAICRLNRAAGSPADAERLCCATRIDFHRCRPKATADSGSTAPGPRTP